MQPGMRPDQLPEDGDRTFRQPTAAVLTMLVRDIARANINDRLEQFPIYLRQQNPLLVRNRGYVIDLETEPKTTASAQIRRNDRVSQRRGPLDRFTK